MRCGISQFLSKRGSGRRIPNGGPSASVLGRIVVHHHLVIKNSTNLPSFQFYLAQSSDNMFFILPFTSAAVVRGPHNFLHLRVSKSKSVAFDPCSNERFIRRNEHGVEKLIRRTIDDVIKEPLKIPLTYRSG